MVSQVPKSKSEPLFEQIDCREDLLNFEADHVTSHLVRLAIDDFPMWLVGKTDCWVP